MRIPQVHFKSPVLNFRHSYRFSIQGYGNHGVYAGNAEAQFNGGSHVAKLESMNLVSAMATVTKSLDCGITGTLESSRILLIIDRS